MLAVGFFLIGTALDENKATSLSTAVLTATLVAVLWYTLETRLSRLQHQQDAEIQNNAWLKGSSLAVRQDKNAHPMGGCDIVYLPLTNVGRTPINQLTIDVEWRAGKGKPPNNRMTSALFLSPGDTHHVKLCEIDFDDPADRPTIDVVVKYSTFTGGGGKLKMTFFREPGNEWANGSMAPYQFWLSDGRRFPA